MRVRGKNLNLLNLLPNWWQEIFCANRPGCVTYKVKYPTQVHFWHKAVYFAIIFFCGVLSLQEEELKKRELEKAATAGDDSDSDSIAQR